MSIDSSAVIELTKMLGDINDQIYAIREEAVKQNIKPMAMRNSIGGFVMADLLVAKTNILVALVTLQRRRKL